MKIGKASGNSRRLNGGAIRSTLTSNRRDEMLAHHGRCRRHNHLMRWPGGFQPISVSALHSAAASLEMKKSANALTFAGRARAVGVTKYRPPSGSRQSVRIGSSCLSAKYCVATNSGSSVMASPAMSMGSNASTLVTRNAPVGVIVHSSPLWWVKRQTSRLLLLA